MSEYEYIFSSWVNLILFLLTVIFSAENNPLMSHANKLCNREIINFEHLWKMNAQSLI